jgi:SAM-dependent methyltransferase
MPTDLRRHSPAAERNAAPILDVLRRVLPARGRLLEVAAGTGQHAAHLAAALPAWTWQPTDGDAASLASISAWTCGLPNVLPPRVLDVRRLPWPGIDAPLDAVYGANLLHIAPWDVCPALMRGAAQCLAAAGRLVIYGPFVVDGQSTAQSNLAFDADLRARDPAWGLRRMQAVAAEAELAGLVQIEAVSMPANNLTLVFARRPSAKESAASADQARPPLRPERSP